MYKIVESNIFDNTETLINKGGNTAYQFLPPQLKKPDNCRASFVLLRQTLHMLPVAVINADISPVHILKIMSRGIIFCVEPSILRVLQVSRN